jgi:RecA/RadA recombinase
MNFFDNLVKSAGNEFASKVSDGLESDTTTFVDTGSYTLNALLSGSIYGGMPGNKVIALAGEESTGKTFYALSICRYFQEANPKGAVVYFESEGSLTTEVLEKKGLDTSRFYIMPVVTVQDFRTQALKIVNEYLTKTKEEREDAPILFVLDSLGNCSTNKEVQDIADGKDTRDMTRSQLVRGAFRVLTLKMNRANIPMIVTNHTYDVVGAYMPTKEMSGGGGLKYAASIILFLSKSKKRESSTDSTVTGALIKVKVDKSRFTREEKQVVTLLDHSAGLHKYWGLLDIAEHGKVIEKVSTKYKFPNGKSAFESVIYKNPEVWFTKDVLDLIDKAAGDIFKYGAGEDVPVDTEETE